MEQTNLVNLRRKTRYSAVFLGLVFMLCVITVLNINIGSVPISVSEIAKIIFTKVGDPKQVNIIWKIRLPRILMAALLGGALSLAGFLLQTFFGQSHRGPICTGDLFGRKDGGCPHDDLFHQHVRHRCPVGR